MEAPRRYEAEFNVSKVAADSSQVLVRIQAVPDIRFLWQEELQPHQNQKACYFSERFWLFAQ